MKDIYNKNIQGHILVECYNKLGELVDSYENHNLIMNSARIAISELACGLNTAKPINKFVLGTDGHITGDYLTAKTESDGFVSSRTNLFSEELSGFTYPIVFTNPGTLSGSCSIVSEPDSSIGSTVISLEKIANDVKYTIEIPELVANGSGISVFSEAALYAGSNIFSMKCFPGKIKDDTVSLKVTWTIKY